MATKKRPAKKTTHRAPADEHAATELVMYIENTSELSPDGPSGQGRSVLLNALRKWRKGAYDQTLAVRLFEYLTEAGAKRYAKEFDSEKNWSTMFTPATRHEAAKQLEASFRSSVEHGEYDHVDTRIGMSEAEEATRERQFEAHRDESGYQLIDEAEGKHGLERLSLEKISVGVSRRNRWVFAFRMGIDEQDIAKGGFHWVSADKPLEAEKLWFEHTGRRVTLQQRASRAMREDGGVEAPRGGQRDIQVGDKVRFTKKFLQNTGQYTGHEANGRWEVLEIRGSFAFVNQPSDTSYFTSAELQADPMLKWRAINVANLEIA